MRWMKHLTAAHDDPAICAVIEQMGPEGYGIYWLLLEHIGISIEKGSDDVPSRTHSVVVWSQICHCSARSFRKFCNLAADLKLIECTSTAELVQFSSRTKADRMQIDVPKLLKYRDEYQKKSGQTPSQQQQQTTDGEQKQTTTEGSPEKPAEVPPAPTHPVSEFPLVAVAVRENYPTADDVLVMQIVQRCTQESLSVNGTAKCVLSDSLVADAVREARAKTPKQNSAGLYLKTVPTVVKTWMVQGRKAPPEEGNYPAAVLPEPNRGTSVEPMKIVRKGNS